MAEIKLSDGTLIKTKESVAQVNTVTSGHKHLAPIIDREGKTYHVNVDQIVYMIDD